MAFPRPKHIRTWGQTQQEQAQDRGAAGMGQGSGRHGTGEWQARDRGAAGVGQGSGRHGTGERQAYPLLP